MGDTWLLDYDSLVRLGHDITEKLQNRNRQPKGSATYSKSSAHVRQEIRQFTTELNSLRECLIQNATRKQITQRETERRQVQLDELITKEKQIDALFRNDGPSHEFSQRSSLLAGGSAGADPWESAPFEDQGISEIRQQQQQVIHEQDQGLDALSQVLARQKQMGLDIGNEIDYHNELIDDITDHVDRTDQRLIRETKHVRIIDRKSSSCCLWVTAVFLLVAIVVIAVIPYNGKA